MEKKEESTNSAIEQNEVGNQEPSHSSELEESKIAKSDTLIESLPQKSIKLLGKIVYALRSFLVGCQELSIISCKYLPHYY